MDLLLISECPPYPLNQPYRGLIYHLAAELAARRYVIDLLCFYDKPEEYAHAPRYSQHFRSVELIPYPKFTTDALRQRDDNPDSRYPSEAEDAWSTEMWAAIDDRISHRHYNFVQVFGGVAVYEYHHLIETLPNACVILQNDAGDESTAKGGGKRQEQRRQKLLKSFDAWMYKAYDSAITLTPEAARQLRNASVENVSTLPIGVDHEYFVPTTHAVQEPNLLFVGDFSRPDMNRAALRLCREVFPAVRSSVPNANLFIVGRHPSPELWACASESITVTGYVPDLRPYIDLAMLYIHPVNTSLGIVPQIMQALAMQTPVLTTPTGCDGLQLQHNEHLMIAHSQNEMVKHAILLLRNESLRARLQQSGREHVLSHYAWGPIVDRYEVLYERIITARRR